MVCEQLASSLSSFITGACIVGIIWTEVWSYSQIKKVGKFLKSKLNDKDLVELIKINPSQAWAIR